MDGQGEAKQLVRSGVRLLKSGALAILGVLSLAGAARAPDRPTPSGLPVPRYVSLKFDKVNARAGPGDDNRLLFIYTAKGLPVQVVAETSEWRRICDPEGGLVWVHRRTTDGRRMVMNTNARPTALLRRPKPDAKPAAYLSPRALAGLLRCDKGWCKVRVGGVSGWAPEGALWGTAEAAQCR